MEALPEQERSAGSVIRKWIFEWSIKVSFSDPANTTLRFKLRRSCAIQKAALDVVRLSGFSEDLRPSQKANLQPLFFPVVRAYRYEATSVAGFIQQLAVCYVGRGYWFYVTGTVPEHKDPAEKFNATRHEESRRMNGTAIKDHPADGKP